MTATNPSAGAGSPRIGIFALIALVGLCLLGCGGQSPQEHRMEIADRCGRAVGHFMASVRDLGQGHLEHLGLTYDEYAHHVHALDGLSVRVPDVGSVCGETVVSPLEDAQASYDAAAERWNSCVTSDRCTRNQVESRMQMDWAEADRSYHEADAALHALKEGNLPGSYGRASKEPGIDGSSPISH